MIYSWLTKLTISYLSCGVPQLQLDGRIITDT